MTTREKFLVKKYRVDDDLEIVLPTPNKKVQKNAKLKKTETEDNDNKSN